MKLLWKATFSNGYVTFVLARSQMAALALLQHELAEKPIHCEPVDHLINFFVTYHPCYETTACDEKEPHWHASYSLSSLDVVELLGVPPAPPAPEPEPSTPEDDGPMCAKCGKARFASVHHPDYEKPNKCQFAPPAQVEQSEAVAVVETPEAIEPTSE